MVVKKFGAFIEIAAGALLDFGLDETFSMMHRGLRRGTHSELSLLLLELLDIDSRRPAYSQQVAAK